MHFCAGYLKICLLKEQKEQIIGMPFLRKKLIPLLAFPLVLASCATAGTAHDGGIGGAANASVEKTYTSTTLASPYGFVTPSQGSVAAGAEVTYTITAYDSLYAPYAVEINGQQHTLDADHQFTATMAEGGNTVKPLFKPALENIGIYPDFYRIECEYIEGAQYKLDDGEWQDSNVFSQGILPHGPYTISVRVPGDGDTLLDSDVYTRTVQSIPHREDALDNALAMDFALDGSVLLDPVYLGQSLGEFVTIDSDVALTSELYSMNITSGDTTASETYYRGSGDSIRIREINYLNQVNETTVDGVNFSTLFVNPFTQLTSDNLYTNADESRLYFRLEQLPAPGIFPTLTMGDSSIVLTDLYMDLDENLVPTALHYTGYYYDTTYVGLRYFIQYDGTFVDADQIATTQVTPYEHEPEHDRLANLFTALKQQNYTAHVTTTYNNLSDPVWSGEKTLTVASGAVLVDDITNETKSGMLQTADGFYRFDVTEEGETTYLDYDASQYPMGSGGGISISFYSASFNYAPEVFQVIDENTFQLRNTTTLYNFADQTLPDCVDLNSKALYITDGTLKITIEGEGDDLSATFTYSYVDNSAQVLGDVTIVVDQIGATTFPYSVTDLRPVTSTKA